MRDRVQARYSSVVDSLSTGRNRVSAAAEPGRLLFVLVFTILTEFSVYLMSMRSSPLTLFFIATVINSITNPATNFIYYYLYDNVFVLESLAVIVESFMIFALFNALSVPISFSKAMVVSFLANLLSYIIATGLARLVYDVLLPPSPTTTPVQD